MTTENFFAVPTDPFEFRRYQEDPMRWIRNRIHDAEFKDATVASVMHQAKALGLNREETYLFLAWQALRAMVDYREQCIDMAMNAPPRPIVIVGKTGIALEDIPERKAG